MLGRISKPWHRRGKSRACLPNILQKPRVGLVAFKKELAYITFFFFSSNMLQYDLPQDYRPEFVAAEFTTLCNEMKKVTGEIDPEPLPNPQWQSSSFASSFNIVKDGLDASSTNPMAKTRRRRDAEEANVDPRTPNPPVYILPHDGVYLLVVYVGDTSNTQTFTANVHVEVCMSFIVFWANHRLYFSWSLWTLWATSLSQTGPSYHSTLWFAVSTSSLVWPGSSSVL